MVKVNRSYLKPFLLSSYNYDKVRVSISVGQVISVEYLDITGDEVSYIKFTGVCLKKKKLEVCFLLHYVVLLSGKPLI